MTSIALHAGQLLQPVPGGIGRYVRALLDRLPEAGASVTAFAAGPRPTDLPAGTPWVDLGSPRGSLRYEAWHRLGRPRVGIAADVVHAPSLAVPSTDRPLVVTVHDVAFLRMPETTTRRGVAFHARGLDRARRRAAVIITPSAFTRRELVAEGFPAERIEVVPLGVDPPGVRSDPEVDAAVAAVGVRAPYVLTVGTVEPRKDIPTIVAVVDRARRRVPDLTLVVVGPPGWGEVRGLDRSFVRVLGDQPWPVVDALYRRATVFCSASRYEGFGLPALEAMARGAPTVATTGSATEEFVDGAGLTFAPGDVDAGTAAIEELVDDDAARARLGEAGRTRAGALTWARSVQAHLPVYARAAGAGQSRS
ncbi:MAG: glycosyltransferase family 4 protein [Actinomycetota bacterium]